MTVSLDPSREQFERRMRMRRAATCVNSAREAMATGRLIEARGRLEEAIGLDGEAAEQRLLLDQLVEMEASRSGEPETSEPAGGVGAWSHWVAALVAIAALAVLAYQWPDGQEPRRVQPVERSVQPSVEPPVTTDNRAAPPADGFVPPPADSPANTAVSPSAGTDRLASDGKSGSSPNPLGTSGRITGVMSAPAGPEPATSAQLMTLDQAATVPEVSLRTPAAAGPDKRERRVAEHLLSSERGLATGRAAVSASPGPAADLPPVVPPALAVPSEPVPVPGDAASSAPDNAGSPALARRLSDAAPASLRSGVSEVREIEQALGEYANAYGRLDAAAAHRVWPSVDERALARAFEGLESQGIAFDRCDVRVSGLEATAECHGRARYVRKVGSRDPLTEARLWIFTLRKADAGWHIEKADAR